MQTNNSDNCFLKNPKGVKNCSHSASIFETQSKQLLATWYAYESEETKSASIVISRKAIDKKDWEPSKYIFQDNKLSHGNPCFIQEKTGRIWLLYVVLKGSYWDTAVIHGVFSDDDAKTWSTTQMLWNVPGVMVRHNSILLPNGHMLLPAYDEKTSEVILMTSGISFSNWSEYYRFKGELLIQASLLRIDKNRLLIFFRPKKDPRVIWRSMSLDNGRTWIHPLKTSLANPLSGLDAVMWEGNVLMFYNPHPESRTPMAMSCSHDFGVSWSDNVVLEDPDFEVSYPSFILGSDNRCHGVYTYNRRMIKYISINPKDYDF